MPTLFNPADRSRIETRIQALTPAAERQWGTMSLPKALGHMGDQLLLALGELEVKPVSSVLSWAPLRYLVVNVMPIPRNVKTAPELLMTDFQDLSEARQELLTLIQRFVDHGIEGAWAPHPLFGPLSGKDWGTLAAKHLDHHLRQFGV